MRSQSVCAYARTAGLVVVADAKRGDIGSTARAYASAYLERREDGAPLADAMTVNPDPRPRLGGAVPRGVPARRSRGFLSRQDVQRGRGRHPGPRALGRPAPLAARCAACLGVGRGSRRRARALERGRSRGRYLSAGCGRGEAPPAAGGPAPAGNRGSGRRALGRRARVHERARERARHGVALGALGCSGRATRTRRAAAAHEAARLKNEVWTASGW